MKLLEHAREIAGDMVDHVKRGGARICEDLSGYEYILPGFPHAVQLDGYTCGVQSTMVVLEYFGIEYFGIEYRERRLKRMLGSARTRPARPTRASGASCASTGWKLPRSRTAQSANSSAQSAKALPSSSTWMAASTMPSSTGTPKASFTSLILPPGRALPGVGPASGSVGTVRG